MSTTFFTADTHFGHLNIIKYTKRPFSSANQMEKILIATWNAVVGPDDEVKTVWASETLWRNRCRFGHQFGENRVGKNVVGPL
jgi:calcineurin-like phosphoesterase family protein